MNRLLSYHKSDGFFWIRIFGRGIAIKDSNKFSLLFSQRYHFSKWVMIGKWVITYLPKRDY